MGLISKECGLGSFLFCIKVKDLKRPSVAALMKKLAYKQAEVNRTFGILRKIFKLAEV
jgi:hypothetical protein